VAGRDYYRCKECDSKIAYGPDRSEEDWTPFLLCRTCLAQQAATISQLTVALQRATKILEAWADNDIVSDGTLMEMTGEVIRMCNAALARVRTEEPK
jgi:hypothetical protein